MLALCKPQDPSKVSGAEAVTFFKKSGVPVDTLKKIWTTAAASSNEYLTKEEFYIALRLIAYAQNNMKCDE
jgi:epidermal growth factor receptor substrate 15